MKRPIVSALIIGLAQAALVVSLAAQAAWDRANLPRAWVLARPVTSTPAVHGRYIRLQVVPLVDPGLGPIRDSINERIIIRPTAVRLEARDGRLLAHKTPVSGVHLVFRDNRKEGEVVLGPAIDCYLPPADGDPSRFLKQEPLWLEVSVPAQGPPRPLRLGTMKEGRVVPITGRGHSRIDD